MGAAMSWLSDLIHNIAVSDAVDFVVTDALPVGGNSSAGPALTGDDDFYVTVRARSLRLPYTRTGVEQLYGLIHSFATLERIGGDPAKLASVTMPSDLAGVDPKRLDRVLSIDKVLVGPTPWRDGSLDLQIGLFS